MATEVFRSLGQKKPPAAPQRSATPDPPAMKKTGAMADGITAEDPDLNRQFAALNLLRDIPADTLKLPLEDIRALNNNALTALALQVALDRREHLPVDSLFKLLGASSQEVQRLAARNLRHSATVADIPRLEAHAKKLSAPAQPLDTPSPGSARRKKIAQVSQLAREIQASIKAIRVRQQLAQAGSETRDRLLKQMMADAQLAGWIWDEYVGNEIEGPRPRARIRPGPSDTAPAPSDSPAPDAGLQAETRAKEILSLGENAFPAHVLLYTALPEPLAALNNLGDALTGIHMESPLGQANFVYLLSAIRERASQFFGAPPDGAVLDYLGIELTAPIALATWAVEGAPPGSAVPARKAVVLRVNDRARFEHLLALYQKYLGQFVSLPEYLSGGARFIGLTPALLPIMATTVLTETRPKKTATGGLKETRPEKKEATAYRHDVIRPDECAGFPIKIIERFEVNNQGRITSDTIYVAYVADAAVLAPDWFSLRDVLKRLGRERATLATNPEFKQAVASAGSMIYMSDVRALVELITPTGRRRAKDPEVTEHGALKISNAAWDNSYRLSFKENAWDKPLLTFQPRALSAPQDLLPRSAVVYYLMKLDAAAVWREHRKTLFGAENIKRLKSPWATDFEKVVIPELGPECGVALLGLPKYEDQALNTPWMVFFKLKTDRLATALRKGKLFKGVPAGVGLAHARLGSTDVVVTIRNGFLIFAESDRVIQHLNQQEKLGSARDFDRAAKAAPSDAIAFGGYNLEAAIAELADQSKNPDSGPAISVLASLLGAFHSQNFYATASAEGLSARMSVSFDREGRYRVGDLSPSKGFRRTYAVIEPHGVPIVDQPQLDSLKLHLRVKEEGILDRIHEDVSLTGQRIEKPSKTEILLTVQPRRAAPGQPVVLPVSGKEFAPFLQSTPEIPSDNKNVVDKAREIAGDDRDAWRVARKLADWTYKNLKWKRVETADVAQTLATREAACAEFSKLFIAMARALGLPARMVSGLAYSGRTFGGHAWVEVYAGQWVELDPTWGTDFVDATHVRSATGELVTYAALDLVDIEVLEAPRAVADFQRSAISLVEKLCQELPAGERSALRVALDIAVLTDEQMGAGAWAKMSGREREQMSSAYHRLVSEVISAYRREASLGLPMRLLTVNEAGDRAEALVMMPQDMSELLMKFKLARRGDAWTLVEVVYADLDLHLVSESLHPTIQVISNQRAGKPLADNLTSPYARALIVFDTDAAAALELVEQALRDDPKSQALRHLKALGLSQLEKTDEAVKLWMELSQERPPFAPALFKLAAHHQSESPGKAIEFYERYAAIVPQDPRAHAALADLYEGMDDKAHAEAAYHAAIEYDPRNQSRRTDLAVFLASKRRYTDALAALDGGTPAGETNDDRFAKLLWQLSFSKKTDVLEGLAAAHPERMAKSAQANLWVGRARMDADRVREALPLLKKSIELDPQSAEAHIAMAEAYRKLREWPAALAAADATIRFDAESAEAHYHRACALARLGRTAEAVAALNRAVELGGELLDDIGEEEDLQSLASLPEFEKVKAGKKN
jgi:tetratricopeptide (TPR) repeat protein